jgi:hypothetical protein
MISIFIISLGGTHTRVMYVKSAGVDGRQLFGIVYRSTANRPPREFLRTIGD